MKNYSLKLKEMVFYGYHGTDESEKKLGQRFIVNIEMKGDLSKAASTDDLNHTVNYVEIFNKVKEMVETTNCNLLERLATIIGNYILKDHSIVNSVKINIKKPQVPIPDMNGYSEIELEMDRS